jgi:hypothetical protein
VRPENFTDPDSRGMFFWPSFIPQWIELFELFEETREPRYLEAAHRGARENAQFVWMAPRVPDARVTVNEGGLAPAYRRAAAQDRIRVEEESVQAWRVSEQGLTTEGAGTSTKPRGLFLACYAPWMLRISALTGDRFLHDIARSAIVGRYRSFPGYHMNTARTTVHEMINFAERPAVQVNATTSIHYNHIWPHIALLLDYLVADAFAKSGGKIDFPGQYAEGYAYVQQKVYGHAPGRIFDREAMQLWMPRAIVGVEHPELNYIVARGRECVAIVFTNQSKTAVHSRVRFDGQRIQRVSGDREPAASIYRGGVAQKLGLEKDGSFAVDVAPEGLVAVVIDGWQAKTSFQQEILAPATLAPEPRAADLGWRGAKAYALCFGSGKLTSVYAYLPDFERQVKSARVLVSGRSEPVVSDGAFPFEFTFYFDGQREISFRIEVELRDGTIDRSPVTTIRLKPESA